MAQPPIPLQIFYPNGGTSAAQMYIWDENTNLPIPWTGEVTFSGSITIGTVSGDKSNNTAAPTNDNIGVLPAVANASAPSYTEGRQVLLSTDLSGALRVSGSFSPPALQNVNITQVAGSSITTGSGTAAGSIRVELPTNGTGVIATVGAVTAITNPLPAGNNNIGDVDVASIAAGTNIIGAVNVKPTTSGGLLIAQMTSADGSTALTNSAQAIKASAGQLFGWYIYNPNSSAIYVLIYNTAAGSVTVGITNPVMTLCIPATSAANVEFTNGIEFTNAGWSAAATTTGGGSTAPGTALEANFFYK